MSISNLEAAASLIGIVPFLCFESTAVLGLSVFGVCLDFADNQG